MKVLRWGEGLLPKKLIKFQITTFQIPLDIIVLDLFLFVPVPFEKKILDTTPHHPPTPLER